MSEDLLIYYTAGNQTLYWALINEQGHFISKLSHGEIDELAVFAKDRHATLLINSAQTNIESLHIPGTNRQRQLQAVPFALEEQLASDIEGMHFALGQKNAQQKVPVISINKTLMDETLALFQQSDIFIDFMSVDVLALPYTENNWSVLLNQEDALIKTADDQGYYCDRENLSLILHSLLEQTDKPQAINFYHNENDANAVDSLNTDSENTEGLALNIQTFATQPVEILAEKSRDARQINLLQGDYAVKNKNSIALKPWKSVAALFFVWILSLIISAGIENQTLNEQNLTLTRQIEKEFKQALPTARKFNNMKKRMERRLKELQSGGANNDTLFLSILSHSASAFSKNPKIIIKGIVFRNNYVDMELQSDTLQNLEQIKSQLAANKKLKVVMSTTVEKNISHGRLRLESQG